jgi:tetratricopeptide (TPR) repeat protein
MEGESLHRTRLPAGEPCPAYCGLKLSPRETTPDCEAAKRQAGTVGFTVLTLIALLSCHSPVISASEEGGAEYQQWRERLAAAAKRHDAAEEVLCVTTIGRRWNWALSTLPHRLVEQTVRESELARLGESRIELLQMLYDIRWLDSDGSEPSRSWRELSLDLLERNRPEEAFAVAAHITDPYSLIALQADKRYARIAKSEFVERDILKATKKELERRQALAAQQPRGLRRVVGVASGLMRLHRYEDVLQLTSTVLERTAAATQPSPYDDMPREFPWILDVRARALKALGRYDEALALLRQASGESKEDPVSHALNLSILLAELGRPQEAVAAVPPLESASAYGHAVDALLRVMVASELEDTPGLNTALDELRAQGMAYPDTLEQALIVAGKDDEAAAELLARLSDPDLRSEALVEVQDYADHPAPAKVVAWRKRQMALRARPDVHRAIGAYGRIRSYAIPGGGF